MLCGVALGSIGCTMAPRYKRPTAPVPEQWPEGEAYEEVRSSADAPEAMDLKWREFFTDSKLQEVISLAVANNRDLRLAALNVDRVRAQYNIQRAELLPKVSATGVGTKQRTSADFSSDGVSTIEEAYSANLGVAAWELDFFGRIRSLKNQALDEYLATAEARRGAQISLVSEVARVYLTLAADQENLQLAQSTFDTQQKAYELVRQRFEAGLATRLDLRRAQTPVEVARVDIASYSQQVAQDMNALNLLTGSPAPRELLPANLSEVIPPREVAAGLSSETLLQRPDVMAAEYRLKGAYAFIGAARAAFFPRISLTSSIGTASSELDGLFDEGRDTWMFSPQAVMPIFDARTWAGLRISKVEREIALTQYEKAIQSAFRDVADALAVKGTIDRRVAAQQSLVEAVSETYTLSEQRFSKGIDSYLGVLDAQRSLFAAQQVLINLRLAKYASNVALYAVLGGGADQPGQEDAE